MSTLHRVREFALVAVLATGALMATAAPAEQANVADSFADLGSMTVTASRPAEVAHLGSMTVTAPRSFATRFASLGTMTVTAERVADSRVADLGRMTVTATRIAPVLVAAQPSNRSWN